ncbi:hypothetical protein C8R44DRAFT_890671 [Mycena epipterygia]|nr:hypothetical protein C8R44DRAFT_890671 [Mycena epipterygia]
MEKGGEGADAGWDAEDRRAEASRDDADTDTDTVGTHLRASWTTSLAGRRDGWDASAGGGKTKTRRHAHGRHTARRLMATAPSRPYAYLSRRLSPSTRPATATGRATQEDVSAESRVSTSTHIHLACPITTVTSYIDALRINTTQTHAWWRQVD